MKYIYVFILMVLVSSVVCAEYTKTYEESDDSSIISPYGLAKAAASGIIGNLDTILLSVFGGGLAIGGLIVLQYIGIDVIGKFFDFITFFIDTFFNITQMIMQSERHYIAAAIAFIVAWYIVMFVF